MEREKEEDLGATPQGLPSHPVIPYVVYFPFGNVVLFDERVEVDKDFFAVVVGGEEAVTAAVFWEFFVRSTDNKGATTDVG